MYRYVVQWLYLVRVFDDVIMRQQLDHHCGEFLAVHTKFVVRTVSASAGLGFRQ